MGENPAQDRYCIADGNSHTAKPDTFADNQQCSSSSGGMLLWLYLYLGMPFFVLRKNIAFFCSDFTGKTVPDKTKRYINKENYKMAARTDSVIASVTVMYRFQSKTEKEKT